MIGRRNSLGNQGVHVQVHPEDCTVERCRAELKTRTIRRLPTCNWIPGQSIRRHCRWTWPGTSSPSQARSSFGSFVATRSFGKSRFAGRATSRSFLPDTIRQRAKRLIETPGIHPGITFHDQDVKHIIPPARWRLTSRPYSIWAKAGGIDWQTRDVPWRARRASPGRRFVGKS